LWLEGSLPFGKLRVGIAEDNLEDVQEGLRAVIEKRKPVWQNK
jgi:hypothetical protein